MAQNQGRINAINAVDRMTATSEGTAGRLAYFEAKAKLLENNAIKFATEGRNDEAIKAGIDMVRAMSEATRLRIHSHNDNDAA